MYTPPWLWGPAMNHGCLHIHPSWLVLLSDFTGVCRLQSRMFMVLSCHVLCSLLSRCGVKEGIDYVENCPPPPPLLWNIQVMIGNFKGFRFNQLHRASFSLFLFSFSFFFISINCQLIDVNSHTSGFLSPPQPVAALICYDLHFYPAASRLANVENCKLNPESPNLRLVSCFSNVHIKGAKKKNAKQGLSNGKK